MTRNEKPTLYNARIFIPGSETQVHRFTEDSPYNGDIPGRLADSIWTLQRIRNEKSSIVKHNKWAVDNFPEFHNLRIEQVERMIGNFHGNANELTWFVPLSEYLPVMMKRKCGKWYPRGF